MKKYIISLLSLFCLLPVSYADTYVITSNSGDDYSGTFRNTFRNKRNKTVGDTIVFNIEGSDVIKLKGELYRIKDGSIVVDGLNRATGNSIVVVANSSSSIFRCDGTADANNDSGLDITFRNIKFQDANMSASGTKNGGAFYIGHTNLPLLGTFRFFNCSFENCSTVSTGSGSPRGGAICVANNSSLIVDSCTFTGNSAPLTGSAISSLQANSYIDIKNTAFESNTCSLDGGAVYINSNFPVSITGCTFYNNTGGALYINSNSAPLSAVNNTFYQNSSSRGAAIFVNSDNPNSIINCTIAGNKVTTLDASNGVVYANAGTEETPALNSTQLINCIVSGSMAVSGEGTETVGTVSNDVYGGHLTLTNCIIQTTDASVASGRIINAISYASSVFDSDTPVLDDHGGATSTIAISSSGAAYRSGISGENIPTTDQRGINRNTIPCIGAYEVPDMTTGSGSGEISENIFVGVSDRQIRVKSEKSGVLRLYNTLGILLAEQYSEGEMVFDVIPGGMYIVTFKETGKENRFIQKIIVQ